MKTVTELQQEAGDLCERLNYSRDPKIVLLFLLEEYGEAVRAFLKEQGYKKENNRVAETFREELGDVFFLLLRLANLTNTDLERYLGKTLRKNILRNKRVRAASPGK